MDFVVERGDFSKCAFVDGAETPELGEGQAVLRVERFAFTANNVTYAVAGDMLSYWKFFPAAEGKGRIPVWGIGVVDRSNAEGVEVGDRFFGYYPMSNEMVVQPQRVTPQGFADATPHRQELPPTYNAYARMTPENGFDPAHDDFAMLFRPLFGTAFILDDFLADNDFFGAKTVILSSASSKTSFGLAHLLSRREGDRAKVIGLTSKGNVDFVKGLGCYDEVVTYDAIDSLDDAAPSIFVDMAGNAQVQSKIHHRLGDNLKYSCSVGITHWQQAGRNEGLPGAEPKMFFAPDQMRKRHKEWGPEGYQERFLSAWDAFMGPVSGWIRIVHGEGQDAVERVYQDTLAGRAKPSDGHILSL